MTTTQYNNIMAMMVEISKGVVIGQVGIAFIVFGTFANLVYQWRK